MIEYLLTQIEELGYGYFFFMMLIGANLTPIPDPVYIMLAGSQSNSPAFQYMPAFLLTYSGMMASLYIKFLFGKLFSKQATHFLKRQKWRKNVIKIEETIHAYGSYAIIASFFLPGMRHIMPIFLGTTGMRHRQYVFVSFSFGFIWTLALFVAGAMLNGSSSYVHVINVTIAFIFIGLMFSLYQKRKLHRKQQ
ncbi:DedA family protein [Priestia megaterium]|nr:DedA family protein [Priestia megaterium]